MNLKHEVQKYRNLLQKAYEALSDEEGSFTFNDGDKEISPEMGRFLETLESGNPVIDWAIQTRLGELYPNVNAPDVSINQFWYSMHIHLLLIEEMAIEVKLNYIIHLLEKK